MPAPRRERRHRPSRLDSESRGRFLIVAGVIAVIAVVVGVVAFGYWDTKIRPKGETVLQVGDKSFSLDYFERRIHYEVVKEGLALPQGTDASTVNSLLQTLMEQVQREELTRQNAQDLGITVTDQEIDDQIAQREGVSFGNKSEAFLAAYRKAVRESGLTTDAYRDLIEARLLGSEVQQTFLDQVPDTTEQVHIRQIVVATEEEAQNVIDRLDNGEDFGDVAAELSLDTSSKDQGGELDWLPVDTLLQSVRDALSNLDVGEHSEPIALSQNYLILEPIDPPEERETSDANKQTLASLAQSDWLDGLASEVTIVNSLDSDQRTDLLNTWVKESQRFASG
jgi:peptidyl-prolyl cis-trans isomerase C